MKEGNSAGINDKIPEIYNHMLLWGLPYLRNYFSRPFYRRLNSNAPRAVSELLHNIPSRIFITQDLRPHIDYLEWNASHFIHNIRNQSDPIFITLSDLILELYDLLHASENIKWQFPEDIRQRVSEHRARQVEKSH